MNDDWVRMSRPELYRFQLVDKHGAHRRMIQAVGDLSDRDFADPFDREVIAVDTSDHYPEHTEQVLAWRAASILG